MSRSLRVADRYHDRAKVALKRNGLSQSALALDLGFSRDTISNFFRGRPVDRSYFQEICDRLGLDLQEIADFGTEDDCETAVFNPSFLGREADIAELERLSQQHRLIVIQAGGGVGKSTLASNFLSTHFPQKVLELPVAREARYLAPVSGFVDDWLMFDLQQQIGHNLGVSLLRLKRQLQTTPIGIWIDNLETALDEQGRLIEDCRDYVELLRTLGDPTLKSLTLVTSRVRVCEPSIAAVTHMLDGLPLSAWHTFFENRGIVIHSPTLSKLRHSYGGNAKAMEIIAGVTCEDANSNLSEYLSRSGANLLEQPELKNLIESAFQNLEPAAARLIYRMGCYRYEEIPAVTLAGVECLLWDVSIEEHQRLIMSLRNRSLLEFRDQGYSMHQVIAQAARERLKASDDWQQAHTQAANYWQAHYEDFEGDQKILACAETFHHLVAIEAFEQAASFIYSAIPGLGKHRLSSYLVWNGQFDYIQNCLEQVENHLSPESSILCTGSMGAVYYYQGDYQQAIKFLGKAYEKHSSLTKPGLDYRGDCWSWMALAYTEAGNLSAAHDCFQKSIDYFDRDPEVKLRSSSALMHVSLIEQNYTLVGEIFQSFQVDDKNDLDLPQDTNELTAGDGTSVDNLYLDLASYHVICQFSKLLEGTQTGSLADQGDAIASLIQGQKKKYQKNFDKISSAILADATLHLFCHLGDFDQANLELYEIQSATQMIIKDSTLDFLALKSQGVLAYYQSDFAEALLVFSKCIEVVMDGQMKVYAPLVHYYLGKTHQALFNQTQSNYHFQEAINWLTRMGATRRIEQVQRAMQNPVHGLDMIW
jgi:tetratricopeptide (TPR) repeat protein/transcriptional regulator with XRE-family HTH domain